MTIHNPGSITRRGFLQTAAVGVAAVPLLGRAAQPAKASLPVSLGSCAQDDNRIRFHSPALTQAFSITIVADTHLFRDDERGAPYRPYSARLAKAYNSTKHFKTGAVMTPEEGFRATLAAARTAKTDLFAMLG